MANEYTSLAIYTGISFLVVMLAIACILTFRKNASPVPREAMFVFRVVVALAGAAFGGALTGFLLVGWEYDSFYIHAGGGLAIFVLLYMKNPPQLVDTYKRPSPGKPREFTIPDNEDKTGGETE